MEGNTASSVLILFKSMSTFVFLSTFGDIPIPGSTCPGCIYIRGESTSIRPAEDATKLSGAFQFMMIDSCVSLWFSMGQNWKVPALEIGMLKYALVH